MSSNFNNEIHNPVGNLNMRPVRGILKYSKSMDESRLETNQRFIPSLNNYPPTGMIRSESKSQKIPHFDEMNIIATYHPIDKDYGHMKIQEPKTPFALNDNIEEEMDTGMNNEEFASAGIDPDTLVQRLNDSSPFHVQRPMRKSFDENAGGTLEDLEHRKQFEQHRKQHYNEFEIVRLRKREIDAELHALEQDEATASGSEEKDSKIDISMFSSNEQQNMDEHSLTVEEQERRRQFELKRRKHYNQFRITNSANKEDDN